MSYHEYIMSREMERKDYPFYGLIMAAIRKADSNNIVKLRMAFPEVYAEFVRRYNAPGGILPEDGIPVHRPECPWWRWVNNACHGEAPTCNCTPKEESGPCSVCQTETTYCGEHNGDYPVWLCPDHGGEP